MIEVGNSRPQMFELKILLINDKKRIIFFSLWKWMLQYNFIWTRDQANIYGNWWNKAENKSHFPYCFAQLLQKNLFTWKREKPFWKIPHLSSNLPTPNKKHQHDFKDEAFIRNAFKQNIQQWKLIACVKIPCGNQLIVLEKSTNIEAWLSKKIQECTN